MERRENGCANRYDYCCPLEWIYVEKSDEVTPRLMQMWRPLVERHSQIKWWVHWKKCFRGLVIGSNLRKEPDDDISNLRSVDVGKSVEILLREELGVLGFDSRRGLGIFLFTIASRTAPGPTQPPIQWVPGTLSLGINHPGREADHSPPSSVEVKNAWSHTSTPQNVIAWSLVKHSDNFIPLPYWK
jgi:hypothetical protein